MVRATAAWVLKLPLRLFPSKARREWCSFLPAGLPGFQASCSKILIASRFRGRVSPRPRAVCAAPGAELGPHVRYIHEKKHRDAAHLKAMKACEVSFQGSETFWN